MTEKKDKPVVHFRVLQSVEDYVEKSGKFRTNCGFLKIPGSDSGGANTVYIPYCEKQRFDFGPILTDYRANGVFTPPEMGKSWGIPDFVVYGEHFHDIHCPPSCKGYRNKRVVALLKKFWPHAKAGKHTSVPAPTTTDGKWTKKEIITAVVVPVIVVLIGAVLAWMTPEGRLLLHLDKPPAQHAPVQNVPAPALHTDSTPQPKAEQTPVDKHGTVEVLPPTTASIDLTVKRAPTQTVTGTVGHPHKKKLRTEIGDRITEGTKIRDIAPIYVGTPEPDVLAKWTTWCGKVEQFLKTNFDAAEVAKFRALDDPNTSLNSKIHFEIAYLEQLLDKVGQEPQAPTTNNASGGIINNGGVINNPTINNGAPPAPAPKPDLGIEFVSPEDVAFRMVNLSDAIVRDAKYTFILVDLDGPRTVVSGDGAIPQILQIPTTVNSGDYLKPRQKYVQRPMSTFPGVQAVVKPGDRIFGYVTVTCPDCKDRRYWLYFVTGQRGWYYEFFQDDGAVQFPIGPVLTKTDKTLAQIAPVEKRIPISNPN